MNDMKTKLFVMGLLIILVTANVTITISNNKASNFRLSHFISMAYADDEDGLYWTKIYCSCYVGGVPEFQYFCGETWTCTCGEDLAYCYDHPGCSWNCSCP